MELKTTYTRFILADDYDIEQMNLTKIMESNHFHDCFEIALINSGIVVYEFNDHSYEMRAGDIVVINNIEPHRVAMIGGNAQQLLLMFNRAFVSSLISGSSEYLSPFLNRNTEFKNLIKAGSKTAKDIAELLNDIYIESKERCEGFRTIVCAKLVCLLALLYRNCRNEGTINKSRSGLNAIAPAILHIEEHYAEKITLPGMAKLCGYTPQYFSSLFIKTMKITYIDYLISVRLNSAKTLLSTTELPIGVVAYSCGFESIVNFINSFKKMYGKTPSKYRNTR